jgi:hypothetical protein
MNNVITFLEGKKTYIVAFVSAAIAFSQALGVVIPEWVFPLLGAAGLSAVRASIK